MAFEDQKEYREFCIQPQRPGTKEVPKMIQPIMKDPIFLAQNSAPATEQDLQAARDLLDTLTRYRLDLDMDYKALTHDLVRRVHDAGRLVNVWTVNDLADARRLADWGVDYITSNIIE